MPKSNSVDWNIGRTGRSWRSEAMRRWTLTPEKIEMVDGKLFDTDEQRLVMLGMLLENLGADAAVRLGDPQVLREAVARILANGSR
jgi:hypothetical protein